MGMSVQEKQKVIESNAASVSELASSFLALLVFSSLNSHDSGAGSASGNARDARDVDQRQMGEMGQRKLDKGSK